MINFPQSYVPRQLFVSFHVKNYMFLKYVGRYVISVIDFLGIYDFKIQSGVQNIGRSLSIMTRTDDPNKF